MFTIKLDDLQGPEIARMLQQHLDDMYSVSPPESTHALDIEALRRPEVTFWTVWEDQALAACGAIQRLDDAHAEIKSMRTAEPFRGRGVAAQLLSHIISEARKRGYRRLSLETGSMAWFAPARRLYQQFGFEYCAPFASYAEDPNSVFMTREI